MLLTALFASNSGLRAAASFLDVVSNNVANSNTTGYKAGQVTFQDLLYSGFAPGATARGALPSGNQSGTGAILDTVSGVFTQGGLTPGEGPLDLAITGDGFFAVTLPDGTTGYTRAGNLTFDSSRTIVTADGFRLAGGITVPVGTTQVSVTAGGTVSATTPAGVQQIGQLQLTRFQNPSGLLRVGNTTFVAAPASGAGTTGDPGTNGLGTIGQGFLEQSNVELANELINLLIAQRTFAFNAQAIQIETQVLQATTDLIR
jgi:flagellar basal-body rod protein FlgG